MPIKKDIRKYLPLIVIIVVIAFVAILLAKPKVTLFSNTTTISSTPFSQSTKSDITGFITVSNSVIDAGLNNQFGCCPGQYSNMTVNLEGGVPPYYVTWYYYPPYQSNIIPGNTITVETSNQEVWILLNASANYNKLNLSFGDASDLVEANNGINIGRQLNVNSIAGTWTINALIADSAGNSFTISNVVTIWKNPTALITPSNATLDIPKSTHSPLGQLQTLNIIVEGGAGPFQIDFEGHLFNINQQGQSYYYTYAPTHPSLNTSSIWKNPGDIAVTDLGTTIHYDLVPELSILGGAMYPSTLPNVNTMIPRVITLPYGENETYTVNVANGTGSFLLDLKDTATGQTVASKQIGWTMSPYDIPNWGMNFGFISKACTVYDGYIYCSSHDTLTGDSSFAVANTTYLATADLSVISNQTFYAPIYSNGAIGQWAESTPFPVQAATDCYAYNGYAYCIVHGNYLINGETFYAPIGSDGIGAWQQTSTLPTAGTNPCVVYGSDIYCIGIENGQSYYAQMLGSDGLGTWQSTTAYPNLGGAGARGQICFVSGSYVYCTEGEIGNKIINDSYYAQLSTSSGIGTWTATTAYPFSGYGEGCVPYDSNVICAGGAGDPTNLAYTTSLLGSGFGQWQNVTSLPITLYFQDCEGYNQYMYCLGGSSQEDGGSNKVLYANVSTLVSSATSPSTATLSFLPPIGTDTYKLYVTDTGDSAPYEFNSVPNTIIVESTSYIPPSNPILTLSNTLIDQGQGILFSASVQNGKPPYLYNYEIVNSVTNKVIANQLYTAVSSTTNSWFWLPQNLYSGNTFKANMIITDDLANTVNTIYSPIGYNSAPTLSISPSNVILTSGDTEVYTVTESGGTGKKFNVELYNVTGSKQQSSNVLITALGGSNTINFVVTSPTASNTFKFNAVAYDTGTTSPFVFNSPANMITVNIGLGVPTILASNVPDVTTGNYEVFIATVPLLQAGTSPYTYNYQVVNSVTGILVANMLYSDVSSTVNSFALEVNQSNVGNSVEGYVKVTDSVGATENSAYTVPISFSVPGTTTISTSVTTSTTTSYTTTIRHGGPIITPTNNGYIISNISQLNFFNVTLNGVNINVIDNFVTPTSTGVTVNYTRNLVFAVNQTVQLTNYTFMELLNISYMPTQQTVTLDMYSTLLPTNTTTSSTTQSTTTSTPSTVYTTTIYTTTIGVTINKNTVTNYWYVVIAGIAGAVLLDIIYNIYKFKHKKAGTKPPINPPPTIAASPPPPIPVQ